MSLKCEHIVSETDQPDDFRVCQNRAAFRVVTRDSEDEFSLCTYHLENNYMPDVTVVAHRRSTLSRSDRWEYDQRNWSA